MEKIESKDLKDHKTKKYLNSVTKRDFKATFEQRGKTVDLLGEDSSISDSALLGKRVL